MHKAHRIYLTKISASIAGVLTTLVRHRNRGSESATTEFVITVVIRLRLRCAGNATLASSDLGDNAILDNWCGFFLNIFDQEGTVPFLRTFEGLGLFGIFGVA